jgi:hypothetical protein
METKNDGQKLLIFEIITFLVVAYVAMTFLYNLLDFTHLIQSEFSHNIQILRRSIMTSVYFWTVFIFGYFLFLKLFRELIKVYLFFYLIVIFEFLRSWFSTDWYCFLFFQAIEIIICLIIVIKYSRQRTKSV